MYVLRLGIISSLLSETLVSGFTTGAAMHVLISQIKDLLGCQLKKENAYFQNVYVSYHHDVVSLPFCEIIQPP